MSSRKPWCGPPGSKTRKWRGEAGLGLSAGAAAVPATEERRRRRWRRWLSRPPRSPLLKADREAAGGARARPTSGCWRSGAAVAGGGGGGTERRPPRPGASMGEADNGLWFQGEAGGGAGAGGGFVWVRRVQSGTRHLRARLQGEAERWVRAGAGE